jgi:hypothetical protein
MLFVIFKSRHLFKRFYQKSKKDDSLKRSSVLPSLNTVQQTYPGRWFWPPDPSGSCRKTPETIQISSGQNTASTKSPGTGRFRAGLFDLCLRNIFCSLMRYSNDLEFDNVWHLFILIEKIKSFQKILRNGHRKHISTGLKQKRDKQSTLSTDTQKIRETLQRKCFWRTLFLKGRKYLFYGAIKVGEIKEKKLLSFVFWFWWGWE